MRGRDTEGEGSDYQLNGNILTTATTSQSGERGAEREGGSDEIGRGREEWSERVL